MSSHPDPAPAAAAAAATATATAGRLSRGEIVLCLCALLLAVLAAAGPHLPQDPHFHAFADQRSLWGVPCALDVLSNLPFLLLGAWGLWQVGRQGAFTPRCGQGIASQDALAVLFFTGLVLTAAGSAAYHWRPDDDGLLWDRLGMVVAFAGVAGLAVDSRIGARAGRWTAVAMALGGVAGAWICRQDGNLLPWAVVQGGGIALVSWMACMRSRPGTRTLPLAALIAWYALAKVLEMVDLQVYELTRQTLSGHSLKHLAAACAALPLLAAWRTATPAAPRAPRR